ncbi:MAG: WYL domain-containing protein [Candidatus Eisenbacteria bacterium]|uniref:WYL domain-containing protein n=1 Tax=Eiseniibacteriota bacterium TaxID=2212470 RepID=A0A948RWI7_UNCEI|nr:WYL domain-containing protein [Candidatus Eisenbacteria bacterium]MBU1950521.1 WYL domain-containing protein [Candidatus Eisenbacteria bacterium]MBU2690944.1 WYL domain-containing protein [Candidatus Eisenbacteria bacterium]
MDKRRIPLVRLLRLDRAVRSHTYPSAPSLARDLNVSIRTIQRDIEYLREQGGPIRWNASRHGYEYTDMKYIPPLEVKITEGDLLAVLAGDWTLDTYRETPYEGLLQQIFLKLGHVLPDPIALKMKDLVASLSQPAVTPMTTRKGGDKVRRRGVPRAPLPDASAENRTERRGETQAETTGEATSEAPAVAPDGPTTLRLRFLPDLSQKINSMDWPQGVELQNRMDGGLDLVITTSEPDEVLLWTLQWGRRVEIISPAWARRHLLQMLKWIRSHHQGDADEV